MKLFIWDTPYVVPYGFSILFAVAEAEEEARKIALASKTKRRYGYEHDASWEWIADKLGPATRVVDVPCAEWHEWEE